jgi:hypothetical protein
MTKDLPFASHSDGLALSYAACGGPFSLQGEVQFADADAKTGKDIT